jgi:steroid 5-alpha reductase family enzyme
MKAPLLHVLSILSGLSISRTHALITPQQALTKKTSSSSFRKTQTNLQAFPETLLRGGAIMAPMTTSLNDILLANSPLGPLGLWAVASGVVVPLTLYRQGYAFSVGYGFSVAAVALYLMQTFSATQNPLVLATAFYGLRLGSYLFTRLCVFPKKADQLKEFDKSPRLKRIPLAASVSLFYACMLTPVLYVLRASAVGDVTSSTVLKVGTGMAWAGALLEAIADYQKFFRKLQRKDKDDNKFEGPTSGVYQLTRHPNYTGEVLFWVGVFISGTPFFASAGSVVNMVVGWACSVLGVFGIVNLMSNASKRLDEKQKENYGGQEKYDSYRSNVKSRIFPFVHAK